MTSDCRHSQGRVRPGAPLRARILAVLMLAVVIVGSRGTALVRAQPPAGEAGAHAAAEGATRGATAEGEHSEGILPLVAKVFNFALLVGILGYFLKTPLATYLASRGSEIRQDLVTAAETRAAATEQLAAIERQLQALPADLEALKRRGAEDLRAEQQRITAAAAAERQRVLDQTRREIEMRLRIARRELIALAAQLAVEVAERRIRQAMTPEDQLRLVDRYTHQLESVS